MIFVGVIPARGSSKGIPQKNLAPCDGKPLLAYTAEAALKSPCLSRVILSTDSKEIAEVGSKLGLEVPFLRPATLAQDDTPMLAVLQHLLNWLGKNHGTPDALVLLQPTSPLRQARHITEAAGLFQGHNAATVVSVTPVPHQFTPVSLMEMRDGRLTPWLKDQPQVLQRQNKPLLYARNGPAVLIIRTDVIASGQLYGEPTLGYVMPASDSVDVDGPEELKFAQMLLRARREGGAA